MNCQFVNDMVPKTQPEIDLKLELIKKCAEENSALSSLPGFSSPSAISMLIGGLLLALMLFLFFRGVNYSRGKLSSYMSDRAKKNLSMANNPKNFFSSLEKEIEIKKKPFSEGIEIFNQKVKNREEAFLEKKRLEYQKKR